LAWQNSFLLAEHQQRTYKIRRCSLISMQEFPNMVECSFSLAWVKLWGYLIEA
jgi:hypothetical protein